MFINFIFGGMDFKSSRKFVYCPNSILWRCWWLWWWWQRCWWRGWMSGRAENLCLPKSENSSRSLKAVKGFASKSFWANIPMTEMMMMKKMMTLIVMLKVMMMTRMMMNFFPKSEGCWRLQDQIILNSDKLQKNILRKREYLLTNQIIPNSGKFPQQIFWEREATSWQTLPLVSC